MAMDHGYFKDVNLTVEPGEIVGLTGPSGRGKTTFCRILAGFEKPMEGSITVRWLASFFERISPRTISFSTSRKSSKSTMENGQGSERRWKA